MRAAFSIEECPWVEVYARTGGRRPLAPAAPAGPVQGGQGGDQGRRGGRVLDDATTGAGGAEPRRQVHQLDQPVQHHRFQLGAGRVGGPEHALDAEARADQVGQHAGAAGVGREVAEEAGVLPVGDPGHDDLVQVGQHRRDRLAVRGRGGRQGGGDRAGLGPGGPPGVGPASASSRRPSRPPRTRRGGTPRGPCAQPWAESIRWAGREQERVWVVRAESVVLRSDCAESNHGCRYKASRHHRQHGAPSRRPGQAGVGTVR